jgi:hypothetical protein
MSFRAASAIYLFYNAPNLPALSRYSPHRNTCHGSCRRVKLLMEFYKYIFLRTFPKLRKATISSVMSVRLSVNPSVRMELGTQWTDFHEILYLSVFWKSVTIIHVSLNLTRKTGNSHEDQYIFLITSLTSSWNEKYFRQKLQRKLKHSFYFQ